MPPNSYCNPYAKSLRHFTFWTPRHKMINGQRGNMPGTCHWRWPGGVPGDRIWVKESYALFTAGKNGNGHNLRVEYKASNPHLETLWEPASKMSRPASRFILEITDLRVERLRNISDGDIAKEGVDWNEPLQDWHFDKPETRPIGDSPAQRAFFRRPWTIQQIIKHGNPWVWVFSFKMVKP